VVDMRPRRAADSNTPNVRWADNKENGRRPEGSDCGVVTTPAGLPRYGLAYGVKAVLPGEKAEIAALFSRASNAVFSWAGALQTPFRPSCVSMTSVGPGRLLPPVYFSLLTPVGWSA